jgi:hypothetical protein
MIRRYSRALFQQHRPQSGPEACTGAVPPGAPAISSARTALDQAGKAAAAAIFHELAGLDTSRRHRLRLRQPAIIER